MPSTSADPAQNPTQAPAQSLTKYLEIPAHLCAQSDNGKTLWVLEPKGLLRRYDLSEGQVMRRHARIPNACRPTPRTIPNRIAVRCDNAASRP